MVEYFDLPTDAGRIVREVEARQIVPKVLGKNTRVYVSGAADRWRVGRVLEDDGEGIFIRFSHKNDAYVPYDHVFVRWKKPIEDPVLFLAQQITETPQYAEARARFQETYITQRGGAQGMSALLSSAIELEAHQVDVVRRILTDPSRRYLLADEVGLGKTIEAGVVIRQAVLDDPVGHRIAIVVPRTLLSQWRQELMHRFGLRDFLDISVFVVPHDDYSELVDAVEGATMLVIDEVHRIADPAASEQLLQVYELVRRTARQVSQLLLMSATPILRNEDGFLRMLHLLEPAVYPLDDYESFRNKIANRQALAEIVAMLEPSQALFLDGVLDDLLAKLSNDVRLRDLTLRLKELLIGIPDEEDPVLADAILQVRSHISETYRLNRRILRNRRRRISGLTPLRKGVQPWSVNDTAVRPLEAILESWRIAATASLVESDALARLTLFYWECVTALLESLPALTQLCNERLLALRTLPSAVTGTFEGEDNYLVDLLNNCDDDDWLNRRISALSNHLQQLSSNTKSIVFCSTSQTADAVFRQLRRDHISAVRHQTLHEDDRDREPDWTLFNSVSSVKVIVCDREAEEGINLQGGNKVIVHFDLPIQPNRIEQRLGRADRYGSGMPVQSYVLVDANSNVQRSWLDVLDRGWNVFGQSISSLQYIVDAEDSRLRENLFLRGIEAMAELLARLQGPKGLVTTELKLIDQQDALDELAPLSESDIEALLDIDDNWRTIKQSMLYWMSDTLLFVPVPEAATEHGIDVPIRFQYCPPEQNGRATLIPMSGFLADFLGAIDYDSFGSSSSHPLSYPHNAHRATAVKRGAQLLRYGDAFVEAVKAFSEIDDRGRSFAMWRQVHEGFPPLQWEMCFRFDFLIEARLDEATALLANQGHGARSDHAMLLRRGDALFKPMVMHIWLNEDGDELPEDYIATYLAPPYAKEGGKGYVDKNLEFDHFRALRKGAPDLLANWSQRCLRLRGRAYDLVKQRETLTARQLGAIEQAVIEDEGRYAQLATRVQSLTGAEAAAEQARLSLEKMINAALHDGIRAPTIKVDVAGVVFVSNEPVSVIEHLIASLP
ncbi:protein DpdE [Caballeronia sp. Lep1P3]|uniref:protein DpdE n=1 Tax=Caballeronia sp. Lep1P3 TaxID=2878150 RepID=UPI001FD458DF